MTGAMIASWRATQDAAAIAAYIRTRGVTRCPTACVLPTRATISDKDQLALARYALARERARRHRLAAAAQACGIELS